jgi:hypothetical protein
MENAMKIKILRFLIIVVLITLFSGILVSIIGLTSGWKTSTQFSNGFFLAGAILIVIGFLSIMGMHEQEGNSGLQYSQVNHLDRDQGFKLWSADIARGNNLLALLGTSGLLLFGLAGLALLIGR